MSSDVVELSDATELLDAVAKLLLLDVLAELLLLDVVAEMRLFCSVGLSLLGSDSSIQEAPKMEKNRQLLH